MTALLAALALALGAAACGGDDDDDTTSTTKQAPAPAADEANRVAPPQVPHAGGDTQTPARGRVIADSGFDIKTDSFAFENYTRSDGPEMRPQEMQELFGDVVCVDPAQDPCELIPTAKRWMEGVNSDYGGGGHCYGFSVMSTLINSGKVQASQYGAPTTWELRIADTTGHVTNPELHADIARGAGTQNLPGVERVTRRYTPTKLVERLKALWAEGSTTRDLVLSFDFPGEGGHAVVPTALEDAGGGIYYVVLYDNNFAYIPGRPEVSERRMKIDTNKDRWDYTISINPGVPATDWYGVGRDNPLELNTVNDFQMPQACPFCDDAPRSTPTTVSLGGDAAANARLRITDADGNVTGWNGRRYVNRIPGADLRDRKVLRRGLIAPEPLYDLPTGRAYKIKVVGVAKGAPDATVNVSGPGIGATLEGVAQGTALRLGADGAVTVLPGETEPELKVAVPGDREIELVAENRVSVRPTGDDVRLSGEFASAKASNPATDRSAPINLSGTVDLDEKVGE